MFRHGDVSTETDRKPFLFTLISASVSTVASVLLFVLSGGQALAIFAGILIGIVAVGSLIVLFAMLTDYAYVDQGELRTRYLFRKARIPLDRIGKITYREKVYYVYGNRQDLLGTINGQLSGIDRVLHALENNGVRFE